MLQRVGRWLRAAGYDTRIANPGTSDRELLQLALEEGRWLITRDRKLTEHRHAVDAVMLLRGNTVDQCIRELRSRLAIDLDYQPFSRCLRCNSPLEPARAEHLHEMPIRARALSASAIVRTVSNSIGTGATCDACGSDCGPGPGDRERR